MPLNEPDVVLRRIERTRAVVRLCALVAAVGCLSVAVYVAFAWAISPCEQEIAALHAECPFGAGVLLLERMMMHLATVGAGLVGAGMLLREAR